MPDQEQVRPTPRAAEAGPASTTGPASAGGRGNSARASSLPQTDPGGEGLEAAMALLDRALDGLPRGVPSFEAVTSSTGVETSMAHDIAEASAARWNHETLDFTAAARAIADAPDEEAHRTRSAELGAEEAYDLSWGLHIACTRYTRPGGDLPQLDPMLEQAAGASAAGQDFDQSSVVRDPCAADMIAAIDDAVDGLAEVLGTGRRGELTVSIVTHGGSGEGGGYVCGSDTAHVSYATLQALAVRARALNIHLVYVIDSCLSGDLVRRANEAAGEELELDALMLGAAGQDTGAALSDARLARQLMVPLGRLNQNGGQLRMLSREVRRGESGAYARLAGIALSLGPDIDELRDLVESLPLPECERDAVAQLGPLFEAAHWGALSALGGTMTAVAGGMNDLAALLDPMNGLVSRLLEGADRSLAPEG